MKNKIIKICAGMYAIAGITALSVDTTYSQTIGWFALSLGLVGFMLLSRTKDGVKA